LVFANLAAEMTDWNLQRAGERLRSIRNPALPLLAESNIQPRAGLDRRFRGTQ
jgi:hypothetical protein